MLPLFLSDDLCHSLTAYISKPLVVASLTVAGAAYAGGIPAALATIAVCGGCQLAAPHYNKWAFTQRRIHTVEQNLKRELFVRLPAPLKREIIAETTKSPLSQTELSSLREEPPQVQRVRKIAIRAGLEGLITDKELGYIMLYGMAKQMQERLPGVSFISTCRQPEATIDELLTPLCKAFRISRQILGNLSSREDACFIVSLRQPLYATILYHYTAILAAEAYPFVLINQQTQERRIYVFSPHIYEKLLAHRYPEMPEKPIFALGTRSIEKFSDNHQRIMSMTSGSEIPTPSIEALESLSLPFYLHDGYHLDIGSAIGVDRIFWNALGKHLLAHSKEVQSPDMAIAFKTIGQFCLDKDFIPYRSRIKNEAFLFPLIGMYKVAGKRPTQNPYKPFEMIKARDFTQQVRQEFLNQFTIFWRQHAPKLLLRQDLTKDNLLEALERVPVKFPNQLAECLHQL